MINVPSGLVLLQNICAVVLPVMLQPVPEFLVMPVTDPPLLKDNCWPLIASLPAVKASTPPILILPPNDTPFGFESVRLSNNVSAVPAIVWALVPLKTAVPVAEY